MLFALLMARPVAVKFTALTVTLDEPLSFKVTVGLALAVLSRRLMPLKPASRANWVTWPRTAVNWVAGPARTVVSVVCCAWLIKDWEDCTSLVIEVMPLLAAWIVLMPLDIESSSSRLSGSATTSCGG